MKKRVIVLMIVILIVLGGTLGIGLYARNKWFNPMNNLSAQSDFKTSLFKDLITAEEKVNKYREATGYNLDLTPVYKKEILNDNGNKLFTLAIYRSTRPFQPTSEMEKEFRVQYEIFAYEVNYDLLREYFVVDDQQILLDASNPTIRVKFFDTGYHEVDNHKTIPADIKSGDNYTYQYLTLMPVTDYNLADYDSVDEKDGINHIAYGYIYNQYYQVNTTETITDYNTEYRNFSKDAKVEVTAFISDLGTEGREADRTITTFTIEDFVLNMNELDTTDYVVGNGAAAVEERLNNNGYYSWLFANYIWWICLIAFVVFGAIGTLFYLAWLGELKDKEERLAKQKSKKR